MSDPRGQRATLRLFRFCLALAVMVVLGTWLASTLTEQQQAAQQAEMAATMAPAAKAGAEAAALMAQTSDAPGGQALLSRLGISG